MNICVTGGAGYIGSVLTERLLSLGHKVTVVDTFLHGCNGLIGLAGHSMLKVIERDIRHEKRDYLNKQDVVFHLAALSNIGICERYKDDAWSINRNVVAEIAKHLSRDTLLVFASSTAIYGDRAGETVTEEPIIYSVNGTYQQTKLDAESRIRNDDNTIILRLATVYGVSPLMRPSCIVNDFVRMAVQDKALMLYDAKTVRPYIHIKDCVDGLIFAMENAEEMDKEIYNLGNYNHKKRVIANAIREQVDFELFNSFIKSPFPQDFEADFSKIEKAGFKCRHSLSNGIHELIKLYSFYKP